MGLEDIPKYAVIDGAMGTEVNERFRKKEGIDLNFNRLWSSRLLLTNEEAFTEVHTDFLEAGADIIQTNSYKPSVENLMEHMGLSREDSLGLFKKSVAVAKESVHNFWRKNKDKGRRYPLVAGSQSPYGGRELYSLEYTGTYVDTTSVEDMVEGHRYKSQALLEGGVDLLAFETIPAAVEGEVIAKLMGELPDAKAWVVFSCKDGEHTCHGERFRDAVLTSLQADGIIGVGVNCSGPQYVTSLLREIPDVVKQQKRIIVYPNNGQVWERKQKYWMGDEAKPIHTYVPEWIQNGANWIGGCCNVSPADIVKIRTAMQPYI